MKLEKYILITAVVGAVIPLFASSSMLATDESDPLAESLEIMNRLVRQTVSSTYARDDSFVRAHPLYYGRQQYSPDSFAAPIATYLRDYGVVVQMSVPDYRRSSTPMDAVKSKQLSPWERTRHELGGRETVANSLSVVDQSCASCHVGSPDMLNESVNKARWSPGPTLDRLTSDLIACLVENGHNFLNLNADERISISLSFAPSPSTPLGNPFQRVEATALGLLDIGNSFLGFGGSDRGGISEPMDLELTGDLHFRQGNYEAAVQTFQESLTQGDEDGVPVLGTVPLIGELFRKSSGPSRVKTKRLVQKLVQSLIAVGDYEAASSLFDGLKSAESSADAKSTSTTNPDDPAFPVPARLVVTASMMDLMLVARGEIDAGEFRSRVMIERYEP